MMKIAICKCNHEFQNKTLGKFKRYFNKTMKGWRCTVCCHEIKISE